jgi:hypothetical protein
MRVNYALHVACAVLLLAIFWVTGWQVLVVEPMNSLRLFARSSFFTRRPYYTSIAPSVLHHKSHHTSKQLRTSTYPTANTRSYATVMPGISRITDALEKPDLDDRSYRVITLPNKLEALLVHDPDTDKASASLNVNIGNFADDEDMPGMAHAVEHLLFMGTKKVGEVNIRLHCLTTNT